MKKDQKTKYQLLKELFELSQRVAELERTEAERKVVDEILSESEMRYRRMVDAVTPYTYSVEVKEGRAVSTRHSTGCLAVTGYSQQDYENDPHLWYAMIHPEDRQIVENAVNKIMSGDEVLPVEHRLIRRDGTVVWVRNTMVPYRDENGRLLRYDGLIENITERKKMEEELLKVKKLESVGTLAGGIAHDFNNLLQAIMGNISLAKMHVDPQDKIYRLLDTAEKVSMRASDITKQLITFSRGGMPVKRTLYIGDFIKYTVHFSLSGSNITFKFHMADDLSPVDVDEGQMRQVIHNMILNAREAMPEGGELTVAAENVSVNGIDELPLKAGKYVRVSISDTGYGIPQENLSRIFDPYFTTKRMGYQKGMGLGLTTCYSIVKGHDGLITVESEVGVGTTFHIYLPASQKDTKTDDPAKEKPVISKGRVLVMDDEEAVRDVMGNMLQHLGYEVEFARDGAEAIYLYKHATLDRDPFDAVILDLIIPGGMGGNETLKALLDIDPAVKAIVISGYSNDPIMTDFASYGFKGVISKPYKFEELNEKVRGIIGKVEQG